MSKIDIGKSITKPQVEPCSAKAFYQAMDANRTADICAQLDDAREQNLSGQLTKADYQELKTQLKRGLRFYTPHAHFKKGYKSHEGEPEDSGKMLDDIDGYAAGRQLYEKMIRGHERELGINAFYITASGNGCAILADIPEGLTRQQGQAWMAHRLGDIPYDKAVHELERAAYIPSHDHFLYIDEEMMFGDELHPAVLTEEELEQWSHFEAKTAKQTVDTKQSAATAIVPEEPSAMSLTVFDAALRTAGITPQELNVTGLRHNTLKILLPTLCQMISHGELLGVLQQRMPDYVKEEDCQTLVRDFYDKYVDPNRPLNQRQREVFLQSLRVTRQDTDEMEEESVQPRFKVDIKNLPIGLRESLKPYPEEFWLPLLIGLLPILMALADQVRAKYCNRRYFYLGGMSIIVGEQSGNKTVIEEIVETWLESVREDDDKVRQEEDAVRMFNKNRKGNERAKAEPTGVVRVVPITISCSKLLKRLKKSQGHCLISFATEADTLLKSNGQGAWSQKYDIYRCAFSRERWGTDYNSDASESGEVPVAYNWTILGTRGQVMNMFSGRLESNVENGLSARTMLASMPDNSFKKIPVFKELSDYDRQRIKVATDLLRNAAGDYETPRLRAAFDQWLEEKRVTASASADKVMDVYRRRAAVIGFRAGVVFMLLCGKESKACVDFALMIAEYTLYQQTRMFGPLLMKQYKKSSEYVSAGTINGNVLDQLPSPFTMDHLRQLKGDEYPDSTLYSIISRWKSDGWIKKSGKKSWIKLPRQ